MQPALALLTLATTPCWTAIPVQDRDGVTPADRERIAAAEQAFAFDLYGALEEEGNACISPTSIYAALMLTHLGARGETAAEMARVLHHSSDWNDARAHAAYASLAAAIELAGDEDAAIRLVNALWGQAGCAFVPETLAELERRYGAGLRRADFERDPTGAADAINTWVAQATNDRISDLVQPDDVSVNTRLVLTNAVYFKNPWQIPFGEQATRPEPFHVDGGVPVDVPTMHSANVHRYAETDALQLVEMPFREGPWTMVLAVPRERDGIAAVEEWLNPERLTRLLDDAQRRKVDLALPRFTFTSRFSLVRTLQALGLETAFSTDADFSGFYGRPGDLYVDAVLHQTFIAVDESGAEAAGATAVVMKVRAAVPSVPPVSVRADRPFLFMIRDRTTGQLLFLGRVSDPREAA